MLAEESPMMIATVSWKNKDIAIGRIYAQALIMSIMPKNGFRLPHRSKAKEIRKLAGMAAKSGKPEAYRKKDDAHNNNIPRYCRIDRRRDLGGRGSLHLASCGSSNLDNSGYIDCFVRVQLPLHSELKVKNRSLGGEL